MHSIRPICLSGFATMFLLLPQLGLAGGSTSDMTFSMWNGDSSSPLGIFVTGFGGQPINPLYTGVFGSFSDAGTWVSRTIPIPPSAVGWDVQLTGATLDAAGSIELTNPITFSIF